MIMDWINIETQPRRCHRFLKLCHPFGILRHQQHKRNGSEYQNEDENHTEGNQAARRVERGDLV